MEYIQSTNVAAMHWLDTPSETNSRASTGKQASNDPDTGSDRSVLEIRTATRTQGTSIVS